jgi:hypothetical protein
MKNSFEERFEQIKQQPSKEPALVNSNSEIFSFINPTELVDIPSKGKFYPEGHPLKDKESIEIRQMTAKEEDILTNKSLIRKGIVIDKLIESLLVDKNIPVQSLLVGDKNAIMVAARIAAYGAAYDVTLNCSECTSKNVVTIDLTKVKVRETSQILEYASKSDVLSYEQLENGNIVLELPKTKWKVECRLMDGSDERIVLSILENKRKIDANADLTVSEQLKIIVSSINGVVDQEILNKAVDSMPAYDAKCLRNTYQKLIPNVTIEKKYTCSSCEVEQELEVPFTQEFFWPK